MAAAKQLDNKYKIMKTLVIYPGRFHPFHRGHYASYQNLADRFGSDNVYMATSGKQAPVTSPFSFADKRMMMSKLGIPTGRIVQVTNPYRAEEITQEFDADDTVLIFSLSDKDAERISFAPRRDGTPAYLQPWPKDGKGARPMSEHGYVTRTPKATFQVMGADADSASQIRERYLQANDADRERIIADLYGEPDSTLKDIFDRRLAAGDQVREMMQRARTVGITEQQIAWLSTARDMEHEILAEHAVMATAPELPDPDYLEEKWSERYKRSINCSRPRGFSQRAHCAGRKK